MAATTLIIEGGAVAKPAVEFVPLVTTKRVCNHR
jgi:hypothetical protein